MLNYLVKTEIAGCQIQVVESRHGLAVIYGLQVKHFEKGAHKEAFKEYKNCVNHALELI